ncbi:GSCOCT00004912001.2-RA-CDS [Cotesia congregata]|uniref:Double-stranded RNA-binding protein Staufen homolog2_Cc n=1 Tax=Cotesia congregata TaxID=51543 RepID=A0A8J2HM97_COTCN|nr:GSCOCT00004912001.2-RA-CDS [Cotesia congregata]CAG5102144.1 Double-stranded RNA-binding protein Staufen homolog2_Cc [Cotesia congregata]
MLRHHHSMQNQLRDQSRMVGPTRQMSQGNMMPPHQPQPHMHLHRGMHAPQQIISIAGHQAMHAHLPHSGPPRQPLIIGANAQNPNGFRLILTLIFLSAFLIDVEGKKHQPNLPYSIENLDLLFGPTGCIEGTMVSISVNRQSDAAVPVSQTVVQYQYQGNMQQVNSPHQPQQQQQPQQKQQQQQQQPSSGENKSPTRDGSRESRNHSPSNQNHANATNTNLANMKEKTPMCLVNELARFNKIQHQYRLTNEQGPAHKKRFTVTLKLGEEEYVADGPSIKKAQHSAATEALTKTLYIQPPPKPRSIRIGHSTKSQTGCGNYTSHLPPTVELNALAMKRGEPTTYTYKHAPSPPNIPFNNLPDPRMFNPNFPRNINHRFFHTKPEGLYVVTLKVGEREFIGQGVTGQAARHDAASRALEQLRQLPLPEEITPTTTNENGASPGIEDFNPELKSPVSLVHETALKRGLSVSFEVVSESGKPHIRIFKTKCSVGDTVTHGEGSSKKVSKKRAAELMLEELKRLPPLPTTVQCRPIRMKRKPPATKKKSRNLIKDYQEPRSDSEIADEVNPISRLVQIQQAQKKPEPIYTLIEEKGAPRRREFLMEVSIGNISARGIGPNKKLGKRAAAEALLTKLGYSKPDVQPIKSSIKTADSDNSNTESKPRKVTFLEDDKQQHQNETPSHPVGGTIGRQLVPGLLLVDGGQENKVNSGPSVQVVAEELREQQQSNPSGISPKEQLKYLAQLLNFDVEFSDFPKNFQGVYKEYLSLVSLSTDPPQVCHGHGPTTSASRDQAALTALRTLSKLGLDSVTNTQKKEQPASSEQTKNQAKNNILNQAIDK